MQLDQLLNAAPELLDNLKGLGLSEDNISSMAGAVGDQLGGTDGLGLADLLSGLDADAFLSKVDVQAVAEKVGIDASLVESALTMVAPAVAEFTGEGSLLGKLGGLAKGLLKE